VGKTLLTNTFAGDFTNYGPNNATAGCRIREFRTALVSEDSSATVELWDVSGDLKYEHCWPAVTQNLNGLIILYNPKEQIQSKEVGLW
jgi:Rab-like protein 5